MSVGVKSLKISLDTYNKISINPLHTSPFAVVGPLRHILILKSNCLAQRHPKLFLVFAPSRIWPISGFIFPLGILFIWKMFASRLQRTFHGHC